MNPSFNNSTWLTTPWSQDNPEHPRRNPIFRTRIDLDSGVEKAVMHTCGLGHYELYINGIRVGDRQLEPAFTDYDKRAYYSTYEISPLLAQGENVVSLYLGRGRYNMSTPSVWGYENAPWRGNCAFITAGEIDTSNGDIIDLSTLTWSCAEGPIIRDSMYGGEGFDARLVPTGWQTAGFDDSHWEAVATTEGPAGQLLAGDFEPIRIIKEIPVADVIYADSERIVYDFGDMLAGNVRIRIQEPAGTKIHIAYAEKCKDSQVIRGQNLIDGAYFQEDDYICAGEGEEIWQARFSYKGFRYVEITGFTTPLTTDQITALVMHQDVQPRGTFTCSDPFVNKLHQACTTALLNNLHHIVTDTPTFEKNGWTGDAQLTTPMGLYNFQIDRFYRKFATDVRDSQITSGELAPIVPTSGWGLTDNPNSKWDKVLGAVPAWDAALFILSWEVYQFSGDPPIIQENYPAMQAYIDFLGEVSEGYIVESGLGDWLPPPAKLESPQAGNPSEGPAISSTAWYYKLTDILYNCALVMGDEACQRQCVDLKSAIFTAFNHRFMNKDKTGYVSGTETEYRQTSNILALAFDLVPEDCKAGVIDALKQNLNQGAYPALNAGILGTRYIFDVLADSGDVDLAWALITSKQYPSWGFWFANEHTSLGEMWEPTSRSWSHHMFGSVDAWFYGYLAGINPVTPGFSQVAITPHVPAALDAFTATLDIPLGKITSSYRIENGEAIFEIELPASCQGTFSLPAGLHGITLTEDFIENGCQLTSGRTRITIRQSGEVVLIKRGTGDN